MWYAANGQNETNYNIKTESGMFDAPQKHK